MSLLDAVVDKIAAGEQLPPAFRRHELKGDGQGQIDIHIKPDWLLIYQADTVADQEVIFLRRTGTHSDLFG
jgi:mRNA interferase YafQ